METIKSIQGIIAFTKVAETGSFSKAAQDLGVSKSHISKTVKQLEDDLGVALFSRSTRKIQLTAIGNRFLETCRRSLKALDTARRDIVTHSETPRGTLRVSLAGIFGETYIAPVAIALAQKYPDLKIELGFDNRIVDLIEEKWDVAIRFGRLQDSSLRAHKIASRRDFICASKAYLDASPQLRVPSDLAHHNCLGASTWILKSNGRATQIPVTGNLKTNSPRVLHKAALAGLGVVKLPGSYVTDDIKKGKLLSLLEDFNAGEEEIWAVTPIRYEQNINIKTFITEVKKALATRSPALLF